jgi:type II secretory pathway pseudopilin PulG
MPTFTYKKKNKLTNLNRGEILVSVLVFAAIAVTILTGLVNWGATLLAEIRMVSAKEQAFQIAEAGIDYYRWHLAQYPTDYQDGTGKVGPYNHNFYDKNNNLIGGYSLAITPPPLGSTKVVITSTGTTTANKSVKRIVQAMLAEPSWAQFAVVSNDYMRFGAGTMVNGPVTSNKGIHFDGIANNVISSAVATYTDPDYASGLSCTNVSYGVHTCVPNLNLGYPNGDPSPTSNTTVPIRLDVFAGRQFPIPATDFVGLTLNLTTLLNLSTDNGQTPCGGNSYRCMNSSGVSGYYIQFKSHPGNGFSYDTYDLYKVNSLVSTNSSPISISSNCVYSGQTDWGTWSINSKTLVKSNIPIPSNGVIFIEDNLWVDGSINGSRMTIAAGFGANGLVPSITINNNLLYTNNDGSDTIGLIAQNNINVGLLSLDNLTIDAALMAENGRVGRYYYSSSCNVTDPNYPGSSSNQYYYNRSLLTLSGMIATNQRYGFAYIDSNGNTTGYITRNLSYDVNLFYSPPPNFPLASTQYQMASWKQIQ